MLIEQLIGMCRHLVGKDGEAKKTVKSIVFEISNQQIGTGRQCIFNGLLDGPQHYAFAEFKAVAAGFELYRRPETKYHNRLKTGYQRLGYVQPGIVLGYVKMREDIREPGWNGYSPLGISVVFLLHSERLTGLKDPIIYAVQTALTQNMGRILALLCIYKLYPLYLCCNFQNTLFD